jgi:hypothetical protein
VPGGKVLDVRREVTGGFMRGSVVIEGLGQDAGRLIRLELPGLRGLELVDDAEAVTRAYGSRPVRGGLALLDEAFVPHYRSPGHPETAAIELVVARYRAEGIAYRALHDGQALLVSGPETRIV